MKSDIKNRLDIELLVNRFYTSVFDDHSIGYIFTEAVSIDWESHLPTMYQFWESILLGKATYKGNPMLTHILLNKKVKLKKEHFDRWLTLWEQTVDLNFQGKKAEEAKFRARTMRTLMEHKIAQSENPDVML